MSLLDSAQSHVRQLLGVVQTRLELLGLELADARDHLVILIVCTLAACFFAGLTLMIGLAWLIMAFWDERLIIVGCATGLTAALTGIALWRARCHIQSANDIFADSLQALHTDRAALRPAETPSAPAEHANTYVGD